MENKTMREVLIDQYTQETGMFPFDHTGGFDNAFTVWLIKLYEAAVMK